MPKGHPDEAAASNQRKRLLIEIYKLGDATAEEAAREAGLLILHSSYWSRVSELLGLGLVEKTGAKRRSSVGNLRQVVRCTPDGALLAMGFLANPDLPWPRF
jgi:hypothetical protein